MKSLTIFTSPPSQFLTLNLYTLYNSKPNCFNGFSRLLGLYFLKIGVVGAFSLKLMKASFANSAEYEVPSYCVS